MTALPFNLFGYPPEIVERARERGVHPAEIQETREDYFKVVFPEISPYRMVSALGRGGIDASGFYEPTGVLVSRRTGMSTYACIEAASMADDCNCKFDPYEGEDADEESWHFRRTCATCGKSWYGLHCPHDGIQNPCPGCGKEPTS